MDLILHNLRLQELVTIVQANQQFYEEFVTFLQQEGYHTVLDFIREESDAKAAQTISRYLQRPSEAILYDGLLRPYPNGKAKWFFLAWLLRDAATQRLQPLLSSVPGNNVTERKVYLLNEIRKFVAPLFTQEASWEWTAVSEVMLARLEGSRRALKGTLFEELVRRNLEKLCQGNKMTLQVSKKQVQIDDETYDVQVTGAGGSILLPVKTRETMGGGHALLFTRDIYKSILVATANGYLCVPIVIAESWTGDLESLKSELHIYIPANPNQITAVEPLLDQALQNLLPLLQKIAGY